LQTCRRRQFAAEPVLLQAPARRRTVSARSTARRACQRAIPLERGELPEGLSVFGQAIESRFADSMSLITGALPAQYGSRRGRGDIQTKSGITNPGLTLSMYGGQWNWRSPASNTAAKVEQ